MGRPIVLTGNPVIDAQRARNRAYVARSRGQLVHLHASITQEAGVAGYIARVKNPPVDHSFPASTYRDALRFLHAEIGRILATQA